MTTIPAKGQQEIGNMYAGLRGLFIREQCDIESEHPLDVARPSSRPIIP